MLQQSGNSQQDNQAQSQGQGTRTEKGPQQGYDDTLSGSLSSPDRRAALQAMLAGVAALTVTGAKAETQESPTKAPAGNNLFTLGGGVARI